MSTRNHFYAALEFRPLCWKSSERRDSNARSVTSESFGRNSRVIRNFRIKNPIETIYASESSESIETKFYFIFEIFALKHAFFSGVIIILLRSKLHAPAAVIFNN